MTGMPDLQRFRTIRPDPDATARAQDYATPEAVVAAMYALLSGPSEEEEERDWERFRALALPSARFLICHGWDEEGNRTAGLREWDTDGVESTVSSLRGSKGAGGSRV